MRIKTMVVIAITALLTIVIMQNTEDVKFNFLFSTFFMPKLVMLTAISVVAFILGILVGRPRKAKYVSGFEDKTEPAVKKAPGTLSDEDRNYIN